jgi:hypothetical protein
MENLQIKFARQNIELAKKKILTEWEKNFIADMEDKLNHGIALNKNQFNKIKELADLL